MDMSNTSTPPREISRVGVLDLTGLGAADALDGVSRISRVGVILVPASVMPRLARIELDRVGATVPIPWPEPSRALPSGPPTGGRVRDP